MTQPNTPPSPSSPGADPPSPETTAPEPKYGVYIGTELATFLARNGFDEGRAAEWATRFAESLAEVETFRDDSGRVWVQTPMFGPDGRALPFDERNVAALQHTAASVLMTSPEAVAVFGGVVYPSAYREARIERVLWLGRTGEVTSLPDIFNSLDGIALLHEGMFVRLQQRKLFEQKELALLLSQKKDAYESQRGGGSVPPEEAEPAGQAGADQGQGGGEQAGGAGD